MNTMTLKILAVLAPFDVALAAADIASQPSLTQPAPVISTAQDEHPGLPVIGTAKDEDPAPIVLTGNADGTPSITLPQITVPGATEPTRAELQHKLRVAEIQMTIAALTSGAAACAGEAGWFERFTTLSFATAKEKKDATTAELTLLERERQIDKVCAHWVEELKKFDSRAEVP